MQTSAISVIIPTLDAAGSLARCVAALDGVAEIIIADGGSSDDTVHLATGMDATCIRAETGRGPQLIAGAALARMDWLLFLHADTVLDPGWHAEATAFIADPGNASRAATFSFALDDRSRGARRLEAGVRARARWLGLAYGDQGLLIHRRFYDALGGYKPIAIMEDIDLIRRIGRSRLTVLPTRAVTSAVRWQRDGFLVRSLRNLGCLALYYAGLPPHRIKRLYG